MPLIIIFHIKNLLKSKTALKKYKIVIINHSNKDKC